MFLTCSQQTLIQLPLRSVHTVPTGHGLKIYRDFWGPCIRCGHAFRLCPGVCVRRSVCPRVHAMVYPYMPALAHGAYMYTPFLSIFFFFFFYRRS